MQTITNTTEARTEQLAFSAGEAARLLNISTRLLWSLTSSGKIRCVRVGRRVLYTKAGLEAFLAQAGSEPTT